jgi:hypothetical protein
LWKEAIIYVNPKERKDKKECSSYRLITILNMGDKLYASIIDKRMEHIIAYLNDRDKTGLKTS